MKDVGHAWETEGVFRIVGLLKECAKQKDLGRGSKLHAYVRERKLLEKNCYIASALVSMYARCGALGKAQQVLHELPVRNVVTWNALIAGYSQQGQGKEALKCFEIMQGDGQSPDAVTFTCVLKACGGIQALAKGENIHDMIGRLGLLEKEIMLGNALVDMYARCGAFSKAQRVFDGLPVRDVVAWNALIGGYTQQGYSEEALKCFNNMQCEGHCPDAIAFVFALKACGCLGAISKGKQIHDKIVSLGLLEKNIVLGSSLVDMYARCGALARARQVLNKLPERDVVTWTVLIAGYVQCGHAEEALECFEGMQHEGHLPDVATFIHALKACGSIGAVNKGEQIYDKIISLGLLKDNPLLGNALVDMFAKCGMLGKAHYVLNNLPVRDMIMWTTLISEYAQQGHAKEALKCFESMRCEGHTPDAVTFISVLKACGSIGAAVEGEKIHIMIVGLGMLEKDAVLGSALADMYCRCGALAKAHEVLDELHTRNVVAWNALIGGYAQQGDGMEVLKCFDTMQCEGHFPDAVSYICALKACGSIGARVKGEEIHDKITSLGMFEKDIMLKNSLIDMYARCGALTKAQQVFQEFPVRDVVMWNALIGGYAQQGHPDEALKCFDSMQQEGYSPDVVTYICALKACGSIGAVTKGKQIHEKLVSLGLLEKNMVLRGTLVDMYARCGALSKAQEVLDKLAVRDVFIWTALIAGYIQQGYAEEALKCFERMQCEAHSPDVVTFIFALKACLTIGAVGKGEQIHDKIMSLGLLDENTTLGSTLVDMYATCGLLAKAVEVLDKLPVQNVVEWNILIGGYAQQGDSGEALNCFERMQSKGLKPDSFTLVCILNACSHAGLLDEAETFFLTMSSLYGVMLDAEHYCCMVDLFGRAGEFNKALTVIEKMPSSDNLPIWHALLGACRKWECVKVGRFAFECMVCLDKNNAPAYVSMVNLYTGADMLKDANQIEEMKVGNEAWELPCLVNGLIQVDESIPF